MSHNAPGQWQAGPPGYAPGPPPAYAAPPRTTGPTGTGVTRRGRWLERAGAGRRWWGRILDGLLVLLVAGSAILVGAALGDNGTLTPDASTGILVAAYPVALLLVGALYGGTWSPGQALVGVVSLRSHSGRRVGVWRGMGRYLAVGFLPLTVVVLVWSFFDLSTSDAEPVRVYRRR